MGNTYQWEGKKQKNNEEVEGLHTYTHKRRRRRQKVTWKDERKKYIDRIYRH